MLIEDKPFWSGMNGFLLITDLARAFNIPQSRAILVQHVAEGSPAERIGLKGGKIPVKIGKESLLLGGDIILSVMGISIAEDASYLKIKEVIKKMADGDELTVKVLREGTLLELSRRIK
jgi:serine protease Do